MNGISTTRLTSRGNNPRQRRGATMLELVVGAVLVGIFVSTTVPLIRWVHMSSRLNEQHQIATSEVANQMERLAALPASQLTAGHLESLQPSAATLAALSDVEMTAVSVPGDDGLQKITLEITWISDMSHETSPIRLAAWFPTATDTEATP